MIPEANTRQRDAPPGAFWFWLLFGVGASARKHYLSGITPMPGKGKMNV